MTAQTERLAPKWSKTQITPVESPFDRAANVNSNPLEADSA